jgi:hypothetical protein
MSLPREIQKIYKRIDKIAKEGRENYLQYYELIDEYIRKGNWNQFKQCLYLSYGLEVDDFTADDVKKKTWTKVLFKTNTTLQDQKYSLFRVNGIYNQGLGYFLEGTNPTRKLGEIKEIFQSKNPNDYQTHRNSSILDVKKTSLEVTVNQVIPNSFLNDYDCDFISTSTQSSYLQDFDSRERIQSGLTVLGVERGHIYQIMSNPESSLSIIMSNGRYQSLFDQKLEIDFQFDVFPYSGTGSFFVSIFNYNKSTSKFVEFSVSTQSYSEYFYTGGSTFSVSGSKIIDVNLGEVVGLSVYKDSIVDIDFNFSSVQINFISNYLKESPSFLISDDISWIKSNNSFGLSQSFFTATASQKLQSKITFSSWDDEKTYDKNMIDLYTQAIEYLI